MSKIDVLREKRGFLADVAADFCYLIAAEQYDDFNKHRKKYLAKISEEMKKIDLKIALLQQTEERKNNV